VNETDVKDLFASAVAHPGVDRIDTDAVLRGGHRRRRTRTAATVGSVLAVVVLVGSVAFAGRPHPAPDPVVADPSVLTVSCAPEGITLSAEAVAATSAGVVISLSSTMPSGASLNYRWSGTDGYQPMTLEPRTTTFLAPPGLLTLSCSGLRGAVVVGGAHTVTVTDPHHFWSSATMAELGCPAGPQLMPARPPGSGSTPEAAVDDYLVRNGGSRAGQGVSTAKLPIGYPDAAGQVWLVSRHGVPTMTLTVDRTGTTYEAHQVIVCAPATPAPSTTG
jgi:hypothetical protein